jgi:GT2 family glycosyltransferase
VIAVIMACHNRRELTMRSLRALHSDPDPSYSLLLFVTDDGSSDGTADAIRQAYPAATIVSGTGGLYWAAAMALAERRAVREGPDYLLWLNDDTEVAPDALAVLLDQARRHPASIIVGAVVSPADGRMTYGGRRRLGAHPQRFAALGLTEVAEQVDAFNGNLVLIPADVRQRIGPIDDRFPHAYADDDYSLRARSMGIEIWQAPGALGTCEANTSSGQPTGSWRQRWRQLQSPTGLPVQAQIRYLRRHGDWRWPFWLAGGQLQRMLSGRR